ncbi:MAG TPA: hypothetical protein VF228_24215 [Iamia sp.]
MGVPDPLAAAVAENARWCDRVGRAAGARTTADPRRWWSATRMPPLHPDAVSLVPGLRAEELLAGIDAGPGCSVKDAYADVDLAVAGFTVVLDGRWWHRPPGPASGTHLRTAVHALGDEVAGGLLASDPDVRLVVATDGEGRVRARAVLHAAGEVVGVSNLTAEVGVEADAWRAVVAVAAGRHLVGWERDEDLGAATAAGCEPLGRLRVWQHP